MFYILQKHDKPKFVLCVAFAENGDVISGDSNGNIFIWPKGLIWKFCFLKYNFHYIKQVPNMCLCTFLLLSTRLRKLYQQETTEYLKLLRESMKVGFSLCVWWRMAPCSLEGERTGRSSSLTAPTPRPGSRQRWL